MEELVVKTVEFKAERISQGDFYKYLADKAKVMGIAPAEFPELQKYVSYVSAYGAIDKARIMSEVDTLESRIKETLYESDKDKELDLLSKNLTLTKNIFNISITREDYKYYKDNKDSFRMKKFARFINKNASVYNITATLDEDIDNLAELWTKHFLVCPQKLQGHRSPQWVIASEHQMPPSV